ncbi:hypothetical protein DL96DRAFT_964523 [Flagelloscypha sp. PMI_526]|nr:hypothetical protein DL96DRAFT_964523 [Flagelloscypha sp. PMI_526]
MPNTCLSVLVLLLVESTLNFGPRARSSYLGHMALRNREAEGLPGLTCSIAMDREALSEASLPPLFFSVLGALQKLCQVARRASSFPFFPFPSPALYVGPGRSDIADVKIIEFLKTFSALPQTVKIFLSGGDDPIYTKLFLSLEEQSLLGKLVMLRESNAPHQFAFPVPQLVADGLFMISSRASTPPRPTLAVHSSVISNGGLISPQSPPMSIPRPIDPSLPLHKQAPPPCNEFYLMSCSKGPGQCKYSHEYKLTQDQLASLAQNAKKAPCNFLKNNMHCPHGDSCCWGHVCPNGPGCYHKSKGYDLSTFTSI